MRTVLAGLALSLALLATADRAQAQVVVPGPYRPVFTYGPSPYVPYYERGAYIPPYSYWAAPYPLPARYYQGYGAPDNFPFYGRPYGRPYDLWTWPYMTTDPYGPLAKYYYPPLG
jgi:hypothetical protein